jgi:hypothetical protein
MISAQQTTPTEGPGEPSTQTIQVIDVPDPLPVPVILSALNTCMADILLDGLIPGAKVVTTSLEPSGTNGPGGTVSTQGKSAWAGIDPSGSIEPNTIFAIHQEAVIGGQNHVGGTVLSLPVPQFTIVRLLPQPALDPLVQCDTSRNFDKVVPGAQTTITNNAGSELWGNLSDHFHGWGGLPLELSTAVATQAMPRCSIPGQPAMLPVAAATTPQAPSATQDVCPQTLQLKVKGLEPGGTLHVARVVEVSQGNFTTTDVWDYGIAYTTQPVDLPGDIQLTDPKGQVFISLTQSRCAGTSGNTLVSVASAAGPFGAPAIKGTLFQCARGIPITGAHPGSIVQAFASLQQAGAPRFPISDPTTVDSPNMLLIPWYPLPAGHNILIQQRGCNADGESGASVHALPAALPVPVVQQPLLRTTSLVTVTEVLQGARLSLLVDGQLRPDSVDVYPESPTDPAVIPVSGPPLTVGQHVLVVQQLCSLKSSTDSPGAPVVKGHLNVAVTPEPVVRGTTTQVHVDATDTATGMPVPGLTVTLNSQPPLSEKTGTPFSYSPALGASDPTGTVEGGSDYENVNFTITLVDPFWTLSMHAGPVKIITRNQTSDLEIDITNITWQVSPDFPAGPGFPKTLSVNSPASPTVITNVQLPIPTGSVNTVQVTISGTASTQGGTLNNVVIPPGSGAINPADPQTVAHNSSTETIAWVLTSSLQQDPQTGEYYLYVIPVLQSVGP